VIVIGLVLASGTTLVITGITQGSPATAIFGGVLLVFTLWGLATGGPGDDDDVGEA
jgi:uncharacterized membrane protein YccC